MRSNNESLWVFALASKCKSYTSFINLLVVVSASALAWLVLNLFYWAYPGGPAWGKHKWIKKGHIKNNNQAFSSIPGPKGFPVIGSMSLMTGLAHHKLAAMAKACGATRLMAFSLGETRVIITSNPDVAKEILNSYVFADRPVKESAYSLMFNRAIGFAPYGVYWTTLRRIAATHLFCPNKIRAFETQRFDIAHQMVDMFRGETNMPITVREGLRKASLSNMMGSVFGNTYGLDSEEHELRKLVDEGYDLLGMLNWSDHLPWLSEFDPQSIRARCATLVPQVDRFVRRIISQHREKNSPGHDFVDVLLSLQGREKLSEDDMVAVLWEMVFRGTDTVAVLIEWVLARMVMHSDIQSRVHQELDMITGRSRAVTESDLSSMVYLPAVVKEVLRLHPPGPLLSWARLAITDTIVDGHHVPAGTTAMVNMWAITRDPHVWEDPLSFKPERFIDNRSPEVEFSVMGSDLRLAPFGSGRRACPGKALGLATVTFWVATLLQELEWCQATNSGVDMSEKLKLSCEMAKPLVAKVVSRRATF